MKPGGLSHQQREALEVFSRIALRYRQGHGAIPVLVVDNANRLPRSFLAHFQDSAKKAADNKIATTMFVSNEGRVPRHMEGTSILSIAHQ